MAAVLIVGLSTGPIFGVPDTAYGLGESKDIEKSGETKELSEGETGKIVAAAFYGDKSTVSYSAKIKGTIPSDPRGTELTIGTETGYLDKISIGKKAGEFTDIKIDLNQYPDFA
jgi:hypothetical protein